MNATHRDLVFTRYTKEGITDETSCIALEIESTLWVNGEEWLSFRCSPDALDTLAAGFLFNEMIIQSKEEISSITVSKNDQTIDVWLTHSAQKPLTWNRTSGCTAGVSAVNSISQMGELSKPIVPIAEIYFALEQHLDELKNCGERMNGAHISVLVKGEQLLSTSLDIGRHNTLDKIAGDCLLRGITASGATLVTTGRISADMVFKAAAMGVPQLISLHSASSLAVDLAQELGMILISHAHRPRMDILTGTERLKY